LLTMTRAAEMDRPKVLYLTPTYPWPPTTGAAQRNFYLIDQLAAGFEVEVLVGRDRHEAGSRADPPAGLRVDLVVDKRLRNFSLADWWAPPLSRLRRSLAWGIPPVASGWLVPGMLAALRQVAEERPPAAVWCDRVWTAEAARFCGLGPVVVDVDDVPSQALRRMVELEGSYRSRWIHEVELWRLRRYERGLPRRFDRIVVAKAADVPLVGGQADVTVVANGIAEHRAVAGDRERSTDLLFVGLMSYPPNEDAVRYFHSAIMPELRRRVPAARLRVAGDEASASLRALHDPGALELLGLVPSLDDLYETAAVVVAPLRLGGGTKIKVLESLSRAKATVCTSVAAEGLDLRPGVDIELADDPASFAQRCAELIDDPARRRAIGQAGRARVLEHYSWSQIGEAARATLCAVLGEDGPKARRRSVVPGAPRSDRP